LSGFIFASEGFFVAAFQPLLGSLVTAVMGTETKCIEFETACAMMYSTKDENNQ
jgi:hypothetical protein